jgi:hypothetical protein
MVCKKCNNDDISIIADTQGKIKRRGCLSSIINLLLIVCTMGLWLIWVILRSGSKGSITTKSKAICKKCGYQWYL